MEYVQPIRDIKMIETMKEYLLHGCVHKVEHKVEHTIRSGHSSLPSSLDLSPVNPCQSSAIKPASTEAAISRASHYDHHIPWVCHRNHLILVLGINTGLRISDILRLSISDVYNSHVRDRLIVRERKTGKCHDVALGQNARDAITSYINSLDAWSPEEPLMRSNKPDVDGRYKAISRVQAWMILNEAAQACGIEDAIGTHTLRKTYGYHLYRQTGNIALVQEALGHSHPAITLRYIGITRDDIDAATLSLNL